MEDLLKINFWIAGRETRQRQTHSNKGTRFFLSIALSLVQLSFAFSQSWQWARHNGSNSFDGAGNIILDNNGNCYYLGGFSGDYCYFTNDTSNSCQGLSDFFIIKYDSNGNELWVKQFGSNNTLSNCGEGASSMVIDNNNNLFVTGVFCYNITFGTFNLNGIGQEIFLAKLDSAGSCIWATKAGGIGKDGASSIAMDSAGNIYMSGENSAQAIFGNDTIAAGGFISKFDGNGNVIWAKNKFRYFNSTTLSEIRSYDIKLYNSHILFSGQVLNDTIIVDSITVHSPQINISSCYASFDINGNVEWLNLFGGNNSGCGFDFSFDNLGNSYVTGGFSGTGFFGLDTLYGNSQSDLYISKFDLNGNLLWTRQTYSNQICFGWSTSTYAADGSTYVTGYFSGNASFGNYNINASTTKDMFIVRYDGNGNCLGVRSFGQAEGHGVTHDTNGNPYVCGTFFNSVNMGANSFTSYGINDLFAAKLDVFTGIGEEEKTTNNQLLIYANPTQGKCNITVPDDFLNEKNLVLSIYDNTGKLIQQKTLQMNDGKIKLSLDAEAKGIYNVVLSNGNKNYSGRIVFE